MLLGCRVVRGPDWKWKEQDGGEGNVGTIVDLEQCSDDGDLVPKTVQVCWDSGHLNTYRVGANGCYDLRILDSAQAGVRHQDFTCDSCMQNNLAGMRWHCLQCHDYDLCSICYMNGSHDMDHEFKRYEKPNDRVEGVSVSKRSLAKRIQCKGIFPGAKVTSGRDWNDDSELRDMTGLVVGIKEWKDVPRSGVTVKWGDGFELDYRVGYQGKVDLKTVVPGTGLSYYKEHLPPAKLHEHASSNGEQLKKGDNVTIHLDADTLKSMSEGHGEWNTRMEKCIGEIGKVEGIDKDGDVQVKWESKWTFHPGALVKVYSLRPGDKVRLLANKKLVQQYQENHGGWIDSMEKALGQIGVVKGIDKDGDAIVNLGSDNWIVNPAALTLESKEHERQPVGSEESGINSQDLLNNLLEGLKKKLQSSLLSLDGGIEEFTLAATFGNLEDVKKMIQKDQSLINQKAASEKTALHIACHQGHPEIVSYLLELGADKEIKDEDDYTALHHAAYGDKSGACVVLLVTAGANVNAKDDENGSTPLHLAVQQDNEKAVEAFTKCPHCEVNSQDKMGNTPLHLAIMLGQNKNAKTILENCQDVHPCILNNNGFNVLHLACTNNNIEITRVLLNRYPAMASDSIHNGVYPLHLAAMKSHTEIARMLLESGHCNIDEVTQEGRTALSFAVGESNDSMIKLLIEKKADLNKEDNDGDTPLHIASMNYAMAFLGVGLSFASNSSTNATNTKEHIQDIILLLVDKGADVNHRNHQGNTPMELCLDEDLKKLTENTKRTAHAASPIIPTRPSSDAALAPLSIDTTQRPSSEVWPTLPLPEAKPTTLPCDAEPTPSKAATNFIKTLPSPEAGSTTSSFDATPIPPASDAAKSDAIQTSPPAEAMPTLPSSEAKPTTLPCDAEPTPSKAETNFIKTLPSPEAASTTSSFDATPIPPASDAALSDAIQTSPSAEAMPTLPSSEAKPTTPPYDAETTSTKAGPSKHRLISRSPIPLDSPLPFKTEEGKASRSNTTDVPSNLAEGTEHHNVNGAVGDKKSNKQISSEIQASNMEITVCGLCNKERPLVRFEPCNHLCLCSKCSSRAEVCIRCNKKIKKKIMPDSTSYMSKTELKKMIENEREQHENTKKKMDELERETECQICMERKANIVFRPCGHKVCQMCSSISEICHTCREKIDEKFETF